MLAGQPAIAETIDVLNELHKTHCARFPQGPRSFVPAGELTLDATIDHLLEVITQTVNPR